MTCDVKYGILMELSKLFKQGFLEEKYQEIIAPIKEKLPKVSIDLHKWIAVCPKQGLPLIMDSASTMSFGMAKWAKVNWRIQTREDLDEYTYYVAGLVGVLLSDLWELFAGVKTDRELAIGYGRGLQAVNILRNEKEDWVERKVSFVPDGWSQNELYQYAEENLAKADEYIKSLNHRSILLFCRLPSRLLIKL